MHLGKVTILHISLRSIAEYFAKNLLRSFGKNICKTFTLLICKKNRFLRAFCNFPLTQLSQNYLKCLLYSLFINKVVYARCACSQIRHLPRIFRPLKLCFSSVFYSRFDAVIQYFAWLKKAMTSNDIFPLLV